MRPHVGARRGQPLPAAGRSRRAERSPGVDPTDRGQGRVSKLHWHLTHRSLLALLVQKAGR
jgi:hypothetical protein